MYITSLAQHTAQDHAANELMAEYLRRIAVVGLHVGGGSCSDEIVRTSPEQAESADRIFCELCEERGLEIKEN